ncbi:MAG: transposase [Calothrix sp. MO_192.B10]|nr:transposase [Calothrix sp. MO_192.B10]
MLLGYKYKLAPTRHQFNRFCNWLNMGRCLINYSLNDMEATYHVRFAQGEFCSLKTKAASCPLTCPINSNSATSDTGEVYQTSNKGEVSRKSAKSIQITNLPVLKETRPWYSDMDSTALQNVIERLHDAFSRFYKGEAKYPKYKNRSNFKSLTFKSGIKVDGNRIKLGKLGWMRFHNSRPVPEGFKIKSATVRLKADGLYVSLKIEDKSIPAFPVIAPEEVKTAIGLDMGITKLVHYSDGSQINNPKFSTNKKTRRQLRIRQRRINRKKKGSKNRRKAGNKVARLHQKITNKREALQWKIAVKTVKKVDAIFLEDLNISGMKSRCKPKQDDNNKGRFLANGQSRKKGLNRSISDASWYSLLKKIEYMAAKHGKIFHKVNPRYSSQTCPECGHVHKDNRDKEKFICTNCGYFAHADLNAANVLKQRGVDKLGLTLSCRVKIKKVVLGVSQKPEQLRLFEMPIPESTGVRRRSAPRSKRKVPGNSEQALVAVQLSLFGDNLANTSLC